MRTFLHAIQSWRIECYEMCGWEMGAAVPGPAPCPAGAAVRTTPPERRCPAGARRPYGVYVVVTRPKYSHPWNGVLLAAFGAVNPTCTSRAR